MTDYKEIRVDFDARVYDTIDQRYETVPMMINLWELGWPDAPNGTVKLIRDFIESTIGIDIPAGPEDSASRMTQRAWLTVKPEMWHHKVRLNLLHEVRAEADKVFGNDNFKRVIKDITCLLYTSPSPRD